LAPSYSNPVGAVYDRAFFPGINEIRAVYEAVNELKLTAVEAGPIPSVFKEGWLRLNKKIPFLSRRRRGG